jgi:hypothetical protein
MTIGCGEEGDSTSPGGSDNTTKIGTPGNFRVQSKIPDDYGLYKVTLSWSSVSGASWYLVRWQGGSYNLSNGSYTAATHYTIYDWYERYLEAGQYTFSVQASRNHPYDPYSDLDRSNIVYIRNVSVP